MSAATPAVQCCHLPSRSAASLPHWSRPPCCGPPQLDLHGVGAVRHYQERQHQARGPGGGQAQGRLRQPPLGQPRLARRRRRGTSDDWCVASTLFLYCARVYPASPPAGAAPSLTHRCPIADPSLLHRCHGAAVKREEVLGKLSRSQPLQGVRKGLKVLFGKRAKAKEGAGADPFASGPAATPATPQEEVADAGSGEFRSLFKELSDKPGQGQG